MHLHPPRRGRSVNRSIGGRTSDAKASKGAIYANIKIGESRLLVFNSHLQASHSSSESQRYSSIRRQQIQELREFIHRESHKNGKDHETCWLLTGDFNIDAIAASGSSRVARCIVQPPIRS